MNPARIRIFKFFQPVSIIVLILFFNHDLYAQKNTEFSVGAGIPDVLNLKLKYGINNRIGISAGLLPANGLVYSSLCLDYYHYFRKKNDPDRSKWYLNSGVSYWSGQEEKYIYLFLRFCRSIRFSARTGLNIDLGIAPAISAIKESSSIAVSPSPGIVYRKSTSYNNYYPSILPALSISFYMR